MMKEDTVLTTAEIVARVLDLHEKATPGPWQTSGVRIKIGGEPYLTVGGDTEVWALVPYGNGSAEHHTRAHADQRLIAYYRTACVELAKRCLQAEAVAAKSREEALTEAMMVARYKPFIEARDSEFDDGVLVARRLIEEAIDALKSSRTDSGQPPATNADESGRATEEDGATKSGAMISASPVAGKGQ